MVNNVQRRFDMLFPGIASETDIFNRTLLAEGRTAAERERTINSATKRGEIHNQTVEGVVVILGPTDQE